ncbi:mak16-a [Symbiodinium sp. CCMP2592]|nr:mak16-a [Symbiodinium sp. CCMP2592]
MPCRPQHGLSWQCGHKQRAECARPSEVEAAPTGRKRPAKCHGLAVPTGQLQASIECVPIETHASQNCWWHANALLSGMSVEVAQLFVVRRLSTELPDVTAAQCLGLLCPTTSTQDIALAVYALRERYLTGLLVLHEPSSGAFLQSGKQLAPKPEILPEQSLRPGL